MSLRRLPNSPYFIACFTLPDGRRTNRSTKTTDRRLASRLAEEWQTAADKAREGAFVEVQARKVLNEILVHAGQDPMGNESVDSFLHKWLAGKNGSTVPTTNTGGANPQAGLVLSGNTLYGTAINGGSSAGGTVFAVHTDGTGFTNLYSFTGGNDGAHPFSGLLLSGSTLYGTTANGGSSTNGTVFAINTDGKGFTNLHSFASGNTNSDGSQPLAGLILSGNTLYGTASAGGTNGSGTVFALHTDGTGFTNLHDFTGVYSYPAYPYPYQYRGPPTNSDGANPQAGLVLSGNTLYGTAINGGSSGNGTVFAVTTDGTGFATLYSFRGPSCYGCPNSDGTSPFAGLIVSGSTLYGTASAGGILGNGTLFSASFLPQLIIIPSRTNVILTWPTNYDGFTLQSATNLGSQVFWTTVSAKPVVIAGQKVVINPISGTQQFFRLSQ